MAVKVKPPHRSASWSASRVPDFEEALSIVHLIKETFGDKSEKYRAFLDVLNLYRKESISLSIVMWRCVELFKEHLEILAGLNNFFPSEVQIPHLSEAKEFLNKVMIRFQYDNECYTSFLNIMNEYCKKKSTEEVYPKVRSLFQESPDLVEEFDHIFRTPRIDTFSML